MGRFESVLPALLRYEGGYSDHPADRGGATNQGVTHATYNAWRARRGLSPQDVRRMTSAERDAIYRDGYWTPIGGDRLPPPLDLVAFDSAVIAGPGRAVAWIQNAVGTTPDGHMGPDTLRAIATKNPADVAARVLNQRATFHRATADKNPSQRVFLRGWLRRVDDLRAHLGGHATPTRLPTSTIAPTSAGDGGGGGILIGLLALAALLLL